MAKSKQPKSLTEKRTCLDADFETKLYILISTPSYYNTSNTPLNLLPDFPHFSHDLQTHKLNNVF